MSNRALAVFPSRTLSLFNDLSMDWPFSNTGQLLSDALPFRSNSLARHFDDLAAINNKFMQDLNTLPQNMPLMNIDEDDHHVAFAVQIPGYDRDQIKVDLKDRTLTIEGKVEHTNEHPGVDVNASHGNGASNNLDGSSSHIKPRKGHYREWSSQSFKRSVTLPRNVVPETIEAKVNNGILTISMQKEEPPQQQHRAIKVQ